ncbi:pentatricopeptide repeat-containing protein At3g12770 [Selaginella moellendorffii]|uniref:pentatricopeptide repeat-containing protein At3g12770 n=1 Tax=Selaginella moellendorffii TaxID=88036 RepID=UPI000D1C8B28|nr:pentatricopeptide repeat-containing protein At3g12770 [Selaginella moellendorffii]|eukprot:XP_024516139.1 pentatricopeptide repeat-containing protein At3g12770 [Selaginella moellendorffii]
MAVDPPGRRRGEANSYAAMLRKCSALSQVKWVHRIVAEDGWEDDTFVANFLIQMYGRCGGAQEAAKVFEKLPRRNQFSWNIMLAAFAQNGHLQEARQIFDRSPHRNVVTWNAMMAAYAMAGRIREAEIVFKKMPQRDLISWNSMLTAYAQHGYFEEALRLFAAMDLEPDSVTFLCVLEACGEIGQERSQCKLLHSRVSNCGLEMELKISTALIDMYGKCSSPEDARDVFWRISDTAQDLALWNAMISAHAKNRQVREALYLFSLLDLQGARPNDSTLVSILDSAASSSDLNHARFVQGVVEEGDEALSVDVKNAIIGMYKRCGSIENARRVFVRIENKDTVSWNSIIAAYADLGDCKEAIELFELMSLEGFEPSRATYLSVLGACSHAGLVKEGVEVFASMVEFGVVPTREHFSCMVDLFGRGGWVAEAHEVFSKGPLRPSVTAWRALCGAFVQQH